MVPVDDRPEQHTACLDGKGAEICRTPWVSILAIQQYLLLCCSVSRAELGMRRLADAVGKIPHSMPRRYLFRRCFSSLLLGMRNCDNVSVVPFGRQSQARAAAPYLQPEGFLLTKPRSCRGTSFMFSHSVFAAQVDVRSRRFPQIRNCTPLISLQPSGAVIRDRRRENPCIALGIAERLRPPDIHVSDNVYWREAETYESSSSYLAN